MRDRRVTARETNDFELLEREEAKRREWAWENALRGHSFVGLAAEVLKFVVEGKLGGEGKEGGEQGYKAWVASAVETTKTRREAVKAMKSGGGGMEID